MPRPKGSKNKNKECAPKRTQPVRDVNQPSEWKTKVNKIIDAIHEKKAKKESSSTSYLIKKPLTFINYRPILPRPTLLPSSLQGKTISPALLQAIYEGVIELQIHTQALHIYQHENYGRF
jgi:hypothetical protein